MTYPEYITEIQTIAGEYMPNEQALTPEKTDELGTRLLSLDLLNPQLENSYHQTVLVYRDRNVWVPITVFFKTNAEGRIQYVRVHTSKFVKEYGVEF
ncbi:MAG: hypothetical protein ACXVP2_09840 [Tumebacillaceae bacterium]